MIQARENVAIGALDGPVGLRMMDIAEGQFDVQFGTEFSKRSGVKLRSIVDCELSQNTKVADYVFPKETLDIPRCDCHEGLSLDPF